MKSVKFLLPVVAFVFAIASAFASFSSTALTEDVDLKRIDVSPAVCLDEVSIPSIPTGCSTTINGEICLFVDGDETYEIHQYQSSCNNPYERPTN